MFRREGQEGIEPAAAIVVARGRLGPALIGGIDLEHRVERRRFEADDRPVAIGNLDLVVVERRAVVRRIVRGQSAVIDLPGRALGAGRAGSRRRQRRRVLDGQRIGPAAVRGVGSHAGDIGAGLGRREAEPRIGPVAAIVILGEHVAGAGAQDPQDGVEIGRGGDDVTLAGTKLEPLAVAALRQRPAIGAGLRHGGRSEGQGRGKRRKGNGCSH